MLFLEAGAAFSFRYFEKNPEMISGNLLPTPKLLCDADSSVISEGVFEHGRRIEGSVPDHEIERLASFNCSVISCAGFIDRLLYSEKARLNLYEVRNQQLIDGVSDQDITNAIVDVQTKLANPANAVNVARLQLVW